MDGKGLKAQNNLKYISLDNNLFILNFVGRLMERLLEILKSFPDRKITVIGDVMLDKDIFGDVSRISPEALAFILKVKTEAYSPGGAANVAANVSSLGGKTSLFGFVGEDEAGRILRKILEERGINCYFGNNQLTTLKIRPRTVKSNLPTRIDYEDETIKNFSTQLMEKIYQEVESSDLVIVSDYAKGAVTGDLMDFLKSLGKKVVVDPKPQNAALYSNFFLVTPNEKEILEMTMQKEVYAAGRNLKERLGCSILVTRGEKGMTLFSDKEMDIPTYAREVYDVAGAGDTAIAALSLSLAAGASLEEAALIANYAAGIAVEKAGTYQVKLSELEKRIFGKEEKLKTFNELSAIVLDLKKKQKRIVWTNGCFDILTSGHTKYLAKAKEQGDYLIVGLNSDLSVKSIKDPSRPINSENTRAEVLSSLASVDYIMIYSELHPTRYLSALKPNVYVKGGDYTIDTINQDERKIVEDYGGEISIINVGEDISTSKIIEKIKNSKTEE